jgi:hypothetical protein
MKLHGFMLAALFALSLTLPTFIIMPGLYELNI